MKFNFKRILFFVLIFTSFQAYSQPCVVKEDQITGDTMCTYTNKPKTLRYEYTSGQKINFFTTFMFFD